MGSTTVDRRDGPSPPAAVATLWRRDRTLTLTAASQLLLLVVFLVGIAVDPRTVGGEPVWLKPAKFAASLALLAGTLAALAPSVPVSDRLWRWAAASVAVVSTGEIALIGGQAFRGVESHFNTSTALDAAVYNAMGVLVFGVTLVLAVVTVQAWRGDTDTHPAFALGVRLGLAVFVLGALEAVPMTVLSTSTVATAWVTVPVFGWTIPGDFRAAHFVGMHGLQVLPAAGLLAARGARAGRLRRPRLVVWAVAGLWSLLLAVGVAVAVVPLVA